VQCSRLAVAAQRPNQPPPLAWLLEQGLVAIGRATGTSANTLTEGPPKKRTAKWLFSFWVPPTGGNL